MGLRQCAPHKSAGRLGRPGHVDCPAERRDHSSLVMTGSRADHGPASKRAAKIASPPALSAPLCPRRRDVHERRRQFRRIHGLLSMLRRRVRDAGNLELNIANTRGCWTSQWVAGCRFAAESGKQSGVCNRGLCLPASGPPPDQARRWSIAVISPIRTPPPTRQREHSRSLDHARAACGAHHSSGSRRDKPATA